MNCHKDYVRLARTPELLPLHLSMNRHLVEAAESWDGYDYGEGYFYQGCDPVGVTGLRDTQARVRAMDLGERVKGLSVLEIGCNAGFLSVSIAPFASRVVGFDLNPHLVDIGRSVASHLGLDNVEMLVSSFEDFSTDETFDVVLSFANHSTYDQNTRQSVSDYFERCRGLLRAGGLLLFESHPPEHEGAGLLDVVTLIRARFELQEERVLDYGTFLDRNRTFIAARNPTVAKTRHHPATKKQVPGRSAGSPHEGNRTQKM